MGYPVITKEQFYSKYDKGAYYYINNAYREEDDSIRLYKGELNKVKYLIFQLPDLGQNEVPENRKNLYQLPVEDHTRLEKQINDSGLGYIKISAQLLTKFINPYEEVWASLLLEHDNFEDLVTKAIKDLNLNVLTAKAFRCLVHASNTPEKEYKELNRAKEYIDKQLHLIRKKII